MVVSGSVIDRTLDMVPFYCWNRNLETQSCWWLLEWKCKEYSSTLQEENWQKSNLTKTTFQKYALDGAFSRKEIIKKKQDHQRWRYITVDIRNIKDFKWPHGMIWTNVLKRKKQNWAYTSRDVGLHAFSANAVGMPNYFQLGNCLQLGHFQHFQVHLGQLRELLGQFVALFGAI